ncbi:hypothetical protein JQ607_05755 [Bradyrhizobium liaoningense]|uniref:hypothetical protein n=1 Tax=Bradyrhizobium liaoningense TaxID=43992 RepID=UPI001BA7DDF1|nr:hypothetical protein [Bradyrhizobium liaoningense]MBR0839695.1 hypothetical protein [Bradyrhizobium liaoningense]
MTRSRLSKYAPVKALAKVQNCIVQLQYETALRTANISIMLRVATSTFPAAGSARPAIGHCINSVTSSPRR